VRIDRLDIRAYGCFENYAMDLTSHRGNLVLAIGDNEAGKSTILHAIGHWLFGFTHLKGSESFRFDNDVFVGGTIARNGESLRFFRQRGKKSLVAEDRKTVLPADVLKAFIGDLTRERFEGLLGLNHDRLCAAANEIAEGKGDIGGALFTAASGLQSLNAMRKAMEANREAFFKAGGKNPHVNAAIREHKEAVERLKHEATSAKEAADLRGRIELATEASRVATNEAKTFAAQRRTLERAKAARPLFERRRELQMELAPLTNLPELRDGFEADWRCLPEELAGLRTLAAKIGSDVSRVESEIAGLPAEDAILADAAAIQNAAAKAKEMATLRGEVGEDQQKFRDSGGEAKQELRALDLDPNRLNEYESELRVSEINAGRIAKLMKLEAVREGAVTNAGREVSRLERVIAGLKQKLNDLPPTERRQRLAELVEEVNEAGDPVVAVDDLERRIAAEESRIMDNLTRLGVPQDLRSGLALAVPNLESIRYHQTRRKEAEDALTEARREQRLLRDELRKIEAALSELKQTGPVPLLTEWTETRAIRDRSWRIIRDVWLEGSTAPTTPERLATDYEHAVRSSDDVAEGLYRSASRVAQKAAKSDEAKALTRALSDREADVKSAEGECTIRHTEWLALWSATGIQAHSPGDMMEWRRDWQATCDSVRLLDDAIRQRNSMLENRDRFLSALRAELEDPALPAGWATQRAKVRLAELQAIDGQRSQLAADLDTAEQNRVSAEAAVADAQAAYSEWKQEWREVVVAIPMPNSAEFDTSRAEAVLAHIGAFRQKIGDRRKWQREIDRRQKLIGEWLGAVQNIADRIAARAELDNAPSPDGLLSLWNERAAMAQEVAAARKSKSDHSKQLRQDADHTAAEIELLMIRLGRLGDEAGVASDAEIPGRLDDFRRRRRLHHELETQCNQPLRHLDADEVLEKLAAQGLESLQQGIDELMDLEASATERRLAKEKEKTAAETELKALESREGAFGARAAQETALTKLRRLVPEYAVAVLAEAVLDQAVQSYRNRNASSLIERAGEYFCTLTGGSFTGLDLDDASLVCVRPDGIRPRTLPIGRGQGLSEGCYDQLFLALRLAFLQDQMARNGPLPIIFDDILLTFDDRRATAALECLVQMAAQTQVLLFTHHRHLGDLARASPLTDKISIIHIA
jgi:uncharacterized protein YhaN